MRILFCGSVTETNCKLYMMQKNIDGFLVFYSIANLKKLGKESLNNSFASIIKVCGEIKAAAAEAENAPPPPPAKGKK